MVSLEHLNYYSINYFTSVSQFLLLLTITLYLSQTSEAMTAGVFSNYCCFESQQQFEIFSNNKYSTIGQQVGSLKGSLYFVRDSAVSLQESSYETQLFVVPLLTCSVTSYSSVTQMWTGCKERNESLEACTVIVIVIFRFIQVFFILVTS